MTVIAVLGAGPHGREVAYGLESPYDQRCVTCRLYDDSLVGYKPLEQGASDFVWVAGQAWPWVRRMVVERIESISGSFGAWNDGVIILPGAQVSFDSEVGRHVHICQNAVVSHGCMIGDFTTVCPGAILCGNVQVGEGVLIGAGAVILHTGITIGDDVKVGAGAVVVSDIESGDTVMGNPARSQANTYKHLGIMP